jgi:hypothetical protein
MQYDLYLKGGHLVTIESALNIDDLATEVFGVEGLVKGNSFGQSVVIRKDQVIAIVEVPEAPDVPGTEHAEFP